MNNTVKVVLAFIVGAAVGVVSTMKYFEKKYAEKADRDIAGVKAAYGVIHKYREDGAVANYINSDGKSDPEFNKYTRQVNEYTNYSNPEKEEGLVEPGVGEILMEKAVPNPGAEDRPYLIDPNQVGDCDDYELLDLDWYDDGVLADSWGVKIEHPEMVIGLDAIHAFDDFNTVQIWVRNDARMIDYEINRKDMNYSDLPPDYGNAFPDNPLDVK